ncbi:hypothetical protein [Mucilaginibacter celer]|uniref:Uncharacterized protein n=1 Tax=Mucilaginibacter celer TaxID=2305508 RepID=A0A494VWE0_9SPHI|nr:hypothetical protein [Mucilaginibacter celer]AYL95618.1 hypothetical protein HYN43_010085 [Mucilaginibacter celer]
MLENDKIFLLSFILRTGMYVYPTDEFTIQSFLNGYEMGKGKGNDFDFMLQLEGYLKEKHKLPISNTRWHGQIVSYAKKKSISWYTAFRKISLEILATDKNGGFNEEMKSILKVFIGNLINQIGTTPPSFYDRQWHNERWVENYLTFVPIKNAWFKALWNKKEFQVLKSIHQLILKEITSEPDIVYSPTETLLELKNRYKSLQH